MSYAAFFDELEKIAASRKRMTVAQSRKGRRPMSVSTLLKKEKDGSLFKETKLAGSSSAFPNSRVFSLEGKAGLRAKEKPKPGDVPTREDEEL